MIKKTLIRGGRIVVQDAIVEADLLIEGEQIASITRPTPERLEADEVIDATGLVVMPGGIDPHVHVWEPGTDIEGFGPASRSAAAGGITTFFEMPMSNPPTADLPSFELKCHLAKSACVVDFGLWGGLLPGKLDQVGLLRQAGAIAFKVFMNRPRIEFYSNLDDGLLIEAMEQVKHAGALIGAHAENDAILARRKEVLLAAGRRDPLSHAEWRPPIAELEAIQRALLLAREVGVPLHIVHLSLARGAKPIKVAKNEGQRVSVETCPIYLLMDQADLERLGPYANSDPPLRPPPNREELWEYVQDGTIDFFASDHAPFTIAQKEAGWEDMWQAPMGVTGLQTMLPLLLDESLNRRGLSLSDFARLTSTAAAKIFGLFPRKGVIQIGADADLVLWDLDAPWEVNAGLLFSRHKWTPYEGRLCRPRVRRTVVRGMTVYRDGDITAQPGYGAFIRPFRN